MNRYLFIFLFFGLQASAWQAGADLKVVTTTSTLADLVKQIGGEKVEVTAVARGTQDPHYIEAKPSYMLLLRNADLLVSVGLELEQGWLPNVLRGARAPKLMQPEHGLPLGSFADVIDKPVGKIDRAHGDMHASGNPHFYLDPVRIQNLIPVIEARLITLDPGNKDHYQKQAKSFSDKLDEKMKTWKAELGPFDGQKVITYHKTLRYFLKRFGLESMDSIEPKPGISPSAKHSLSLIRQAKEQKVTCILNESFFETTAATRIAKEIGGQYKVVPTEVGATPKAKDYVSLLEEVVNLTKSCLTPKE